MVVEDVESNPSSTKLVGGITGKGWKPGQTGNPGGRPRNYLDDLLRSKVQEPSPRNPGLTIGDDLVLELVNIALTALPAERMRAIEYTFNRLGGSPRQSVEVSGAEDDPRTLALSALAEALRGDNAARLVTTPKPELAAPS